MVDPRDERVVPKNMNPCNGLLMEHVARYKFAGSFVWGRVLDIACGVGYGSEIILKGPGRWLVKEMVGFDNDPASIEYARKHYFHPKANFVLGDALDTNLHESIGLFDSIISFETIEHLEQDEAFIENLKKVLKDDGLLIISTPLGQGRNKPCTCPFHFFQYTLEEFQKLLEKNFNEVEIFLQKDIVIEKPIPGKKYYLAVATCRK